MAHRFSAATGGKYEIAICCCVVVLGLASANATGYSLSFSANSAFSPWPPQARACITSSATFAPITLFDGDTLFIQFMNVPISPSPIFVGSLTTLGAQGAGAQIQESLFQDGVMVGGIGSYSCGIANSCIPHDCFSSTWLLLFQVLSGEPVSSTGLSINSVRAEQDYVPLPAAIPLFASGLGALGLLGWRRKRKNTAAIAA
jgi:hypothetical protein